MPTQKRPEALADWYFSKTGKFLPLDHPSTFNEKIQWLKLYGPRNVYSHLSDKYRVRQWVQEKIGEKYLIPLLGTWHHAEDIGFTSLPDKFVLKCNHGSGYNIVVTDKNKLDISSTIRKLNTWLAEDYAFKSGLELFYSDIPRKIIAEKYMENTFHDLYDYKFWCFHGKVHYIQFLSERNTNGLKMAFYDRNWKKQDFVYTYPLDTKIMAKPANLDFMIQLAETLAQGFPHVRVDFYRLNDGTIYFGEMTFTSMTGIARWCPENADKKLGELIHLPAPEILK